MLINLFALLSGLVFGIGLIIAGMANPAKVLGFLDLAGPWDPSLAFVMLGGIAVGLLAFARVKPGSLSWLKQPIQLPTTSSINARLILGSAVFGIGWGLAGICPGPALVLVGAGYWQGLLFVAAMLGGMLIFEWLESRKRRQQQPSEQR